MHNLLRTLAYINMRDHGEHPNYRAALSDRESEKWLEAMNAEMQSLKDNQVWNLADLPLNCKTVGSKWLFKKKTYMDGNTHTYKARLVAKGFTQTYGVDYEDTFSPVSDIKSVRILIAIAAYYDYEICILDEYANFKDPFMDLSKLLGAGTRDLMRRSKDLGEAAYILRIKIYQDRSRRLIGLSQNAYIDKTLKRFRMDTSKCRTIPMQPNVDLSNTQGPSTPAEVKWMKGIPYASAMGSIMYANPGESHWTAVKNILKYLKNTKDMFLIYGGDSTTELGVTCYTDASWKTNQDDL
ncbi:retrotransposon protein, putative, ty1-copia subclass [Tanacetum coccineum]